MSRRSRALPRGWYPADKRECQREIESFLEGWSPPIAIEKARGGIVPHAGWYFSGRLAARVFHLLQSGGKVDLIVLYGGHLGAEDLPRMIMEEAWETPLGEIEIRQDFARKLLKKIEAKAESPSSVDNTVEIQLAMVKYFFPESQLLAIRSPHSSRAVILGREIAGLAREEGISLLAIGSTDLTHYGPNYGFVSRGTGPSALKWVKNENDRGWIDLALKMDEEGLLKHALEHDSACSGGAAASAIASCKVLGAEKGTLVDYYTSYDVMPDDSFVGYAGIVY